METGLSNCCIETRDQEAFPRLFDGGTAVNIRSDMARGGFCCQIKNYEWRILSEVNANVHRAFGCVGTITDGAIRDVDEMCNAGFKAIARRLCVGHAYTTPVEWGCEVDVFGCRVREDALIHADKHGFLVTPEEDQKGLYEAACFMDANECRTIIGAARASSGKTHNQILQELNQAVEEFTRNAAEKYGRKGEL